MRPSAVRTASLPPGSLLERYQQNGAFTDCRSTELRSSVTLSEFITAFYSSTAFRPERWLLGILLGRGATAADVASLASAHTESFAAWSVEARLADQILLCDYQGRTRSWLMVERIEQGTRLYFGSAVITGRSGTGSIVFRALLGFHRVYSHVLLGSAVKALMR